MSDDARTEAGTLSTETFRRLLHDQVQKICNDRGLDIQVHKSKGTAFQVWCADLLRRANRDVETDIDDAIFETNDLGADVVLEDRLNERLIIAQCKCGNFQSKAAPIAEEPVTAFLQRHQQYQRRDWVKRFADERLGGILGDYTELLVQGWKVAYYFITTDAASEKLHKLVDQANEHAGKNGQSVQFTLLDRPPLKEFYQRTLSLDGHLGVDLEADLPANSFFMIYDPYPTLVAAVKANWIRQVYNRNGAKERVFALNIRDWLGRRTGINKTMVETVRQEPANFFYYNNGISAVCSKLTVDVDKRKVIAKDFQIINGAQTVGAIVDAGDQDGARVLLRITDAGSKSKSINDRIIRYNNTQNIVKISDFCANDHIQLWLEDEFAKLKHREHIPTLTYIRRRGVSSRARKGSTAFRLEDLAKIRYAYLVEPTLIINSPKDLFTSRTQHSEGYYEVAFGVNGSLEPVWPDPVFTEAQLAIAFSIFFDEQIATQREKHSASRFLNQCRYMLISLAGEVARKLPQSKIKELVASPAKFFEVARPIWEDGYLTISSEWRRNEKAADKGADKLTLRTFARSKDVWESIRDDFLERRSIKQP